MANSKQNFLGLVKIEGIQSDAYRDLAKTGKLIFAHLWDSESEDAKVNERFIINANGIEYKIATEDIFESLEARVAALEAWKPDVDSSIDRLDSSVSALESLLADYSEWKVSVDASIDDLQAKDVEIDSSINDISTRLSTALASAQIASAAIADGSTLVTLTTTDKSNTVATSSFKVAGNGYVTLSGDANHINVAVTTASVEDTTVSGVGLADAGDVHNYVQGLIQGLEGALVFKGEVNDSSALPVDASKGDTYVATAAMTSPKADAGDLFIYSGSDWVQVERNLDGAVTAGAALDSSHLVVGTGAQGVKTINVTAESLIEAIANANAALRGVNPASNQNDYVTISVESGDASTVDVSAVLSVVDTSVALKTISTTGSLVDAKAVKDYVDEAINEIPEVQMTLDSSTPAYVETTATVSNGTITATVGVKTATLVDASNGTNGLATALDVYTELTKVEEVMATSVTTMATTLGLDDSLGVTWSQQSGIPATASYKEAIEGAYEEAHKAGVTSFGGATGAISIATVSDATHNVVFNMNSSTLEANVDLSGIEQRIADVSQHAIDNDASIVALKAKDVEIDSSIVRIDSSVADHEARIDALEGATYVREVVGESDVLTNANDAYVNVAAITDTQTGIVTLDSSVQLASFVPDATITPATATGLATDALVKDYVEDRLLWEVIS